MIARNQNFRHLPSPELRGPRVMRMFHQLRSSCRIRKRIPQDRFFLADNSRNIPRDGIHDNDRGDFSSRNNEIAYRNFRRRQVFGDALIDAFVAAADQDHLLRFRQAAALRPD